MEPILAVISDGDLVWATILTIFAIPIAGYILAVIGQVIDAFSPTRKSRE